MQKKIIYVLVLMSFCVLGITGLQLYWNYKNYKTTVANFKTDANNALDISVNKELTFRQQELTLKFRKWLADTSIININSNINNRDSNTVFTVRDVNPRFLEDTSRKVKFYDFGITSFKQKLKKITPAAKALFIDHFAEKIFKEHLKTGTIWYYTQALGDSITVSYDKSKVKMERLNSIYKDELAKKNIYSSFILNNTSKLKDNFLTKKVNTSLRRPFKKEMVWASLENPNQYYLSEMKWLIVSSLVLIGITLFCFYYTIKTLFNQYKLVEIKNQFISNMTHEINTPLTSIQVTTEALKQFKLGKETTDKYLDIILYQTNKLIELCKEILENAKLETLTFNMNEEVELNELIFLVLKELNLDTNVKLSYLSNDENIVIKGNKAHLMRSISNILENSFKYNSSINPTIEVILTKSKEGINLTIKDNGSGIKDEFKQKIFEQFYRVPTGNMHNIKGYGLGLSYVKRVISQHKGIIQVLDNHPMGTIFSINLPS